MIDLNLRSAYQKAAPTRETAERIYAGLLLARSEAQPRSAPGGNRFLRRMAVAAACLGLLAALLTAGYAAYEKWRLPDPEPYVPDQNHGNVQVHNETICTTPGQAEETETAPGSMTDGWFLARGAEILEQAGIAVPADARFTLRRQTHLAWDREEVELRYELDGNPVTVTFDGETGVFLGMSGIRWVIPETAACATQEEADALAEAYYRSLPVEQGYHMTDREQYDEQFWSYDFCREVEPGLFNPYECVRIGINPVSGSLESCNVFYVPLLDDHQPEDRPLTQEEAQAAAEQNLDLSRYQLLSVNEVVGLPNWNFTEKENLGPNLKYAKVTRLCWELVYDNSGEFADVVRVLVDFYTGEILGGDSTG